MERINAFQHKLSDQEFYEARLDALEEAVTSGSVARLHIIDATYEFANEALLGGKSVEYIFHEGSKRVTARVGKDSRSFFLLGENSSLSHGPFEYSE